jgi:electron transfer flavoprotein alpha subunit
MILGLVEHDRGQLNEACLQMLTLGRRLAGQLNAPLGAVVVSAEAGPWLERLGALGVSVVFHAGHELLVDYAPAAWAQCVIEAISAAGAQAALAIGTDRGNEVMAHVAARMNLPMAANCTDVQPGDPYRVTRLRWGGSLLEKAALKSSMALLTLALHSVAIEESPVQGIEVRAFTPTLSDKDVRVQVTSRIESAGGKVSLAEAKLVVGGGRGVGSPEGFKPLDELAGMLDGAVGCSRAVTSLGWRPHADQIGQTGTRIAPDLYIACGVSGATQHMVGCAGAKKILAINTDPEAPIVTKADYAVIGDLLEVVPALCAEIRKVRQA